MNRVLARRMTLSVPRYGGVPKFTEPKFAVDWVHPGEVWLFDSIANRIEEIFSFRSKPS